MSRKTKIAIIGMLSIAMIAAIVIIPQTKPIGTIRGAEMELIIIDDVVYEQDNNLPFSAADKGNFLGFVNNEKIKFKVYSVKGDLEQQYLYRLWGYDGAFYAAINEEE